MRIFSSPFLLNSFFILQVCSWLFFARNFLLLLVFLISPQDISKWHGNCSSHPSSSLNIMKNDLRGNYLMLSFKTHSLDAIEPAPAHVFMNILLDFILFGLIAPAVCIVSIINQFHSCFANALKDLMLKIKFGFDHFERARTFRNIEHCRSIRTYARRIGSVRFSSVQFGSLWFGTVHAKCFRVIA